MAVTYDESVIVAFAERLYRRAATIVITTALLFMLFGAAGGAAVAALSRMPTDSRNGLAVVMGLIGAIIGAVIGSERAFTLRLMAQQALCQVQIERNTRAQAAIRTGAVQPIAPQLSQISQPQQPTRGGW